MSRRLTQAEIEEFLLSVGDPTTQKEVAQRSKLTKLTKSITNVGDKLRVTVINKLDDLQSNRKKRKFEKWCQKEKIFGVHIDSHNDQVDYDEVQSVIQEVLNEADQMKQLDATQKDNPPEREM